MKNDSINLQTDKSEYNNMYLVHSTYHPYYFLLLYIMGTAVCKWKQVLVVNDPSD